MRLGTVNTPGCETHCCLQVRRVAYDLAEAQNEIDRQLLKSSETKDASAGESLCCWSESDKGVPCYADLVLQPSKSSLKPSRRRTNCNMKKRFSKPCAANDSANNVTPCT